MNTAVLLAFTSYFAILLIIGLTAHKKNSTATDFMLGNRSLNFWITAISAHASDMSSWLFMAFPMSIFLAGVEKGWIAIALITGMFLNWHFVAPKLRIATEIYQANTLSSFFEKRFNDTSGIIRILSALMSLIFLTFYVSAGLISLGFLFESLFHINYYIGIFAATLIVVIYTFAGGFLTVAWTDLFQGLFLLLMLFLVSFVAFLKIPGFSSIYEVASNKKISLSFFPDSKTGSYLNIVYLILSWGLGYFGQPHIITKFMGIKRPDEMYKSKYLGICWQICALSAAAFIGLIGIVYFPNGMQNPELIFVEIVKDLFNPFISGFILCAVFAATMSTMDSQILVCASVMTEDLYKKIINPKANNNQTLKITRFCVVGIAIFALFLASDKSKTIMESVSYAWSGLGCSFGPLVLASLHSKKANRYGAIAGIISGGIVAGFWPSLNSLYLHTLIPSMIPGFISGIIAIYGISFLTKEKPVADKIII